jgi:hypothetical protein
MVFLWVESFFLRIGGYPIVLGLAGQSEWSFAVWMPRLHRSRTHHLDCAAMYPSRFGFQSTKGSLPGTYELSPEEVIRYCASLRGMLAGEL